MSIRVNRVLFFSQRLVSEQYLDGAMGYVAAVPPPPNTSDPLMASYRKTLAVDYNELRIEYDAML